MLYFLQLELPATENSCEPFQRAKISVTFKWVLCALNMFLSVFKNFSLAFVNFVSGYFTAMATKTFHGQFSETTNIV